MPLYPGHGLEGKCPFKLVFMVLIFEQKLFASEYLEWLKKYFAGIFNILSRNSVFKHEQIFPSKFFLAWTRIDEIGNCLV